MLKKLGAGLATVVAVFASGCSKDANSPPESWVGKSVVVNREGNGSDFEGVYGHKGLSATSVFKVVTDNQGVTEDGSEIRVITFQDERGTEGFGAASRFKVYEP